MNVVVRRLLLPVLALTWVLAAASPAAAIVGGANATSGDWPWQVQLSAGPYLCGGSLVAPDRVVTAAHCTEGLNPGDVSIRSGSVLRNGGTRTAVAEIAEHPDVELGGDVPRRDLAVLQLAADAPGEPIALVDPAADLGLWNDPGDLLWVTGWGLTQPAPLGGDVASTLQEVEIPHVTDASCAAEWTGAFAQADMVCAGEAGQDSCNGDSGGPLVAPTGPAAAQGDPQSWRLVGVVSWGAEYCAGVGQDEPVGPGVYARLGASSLHDHADPAATPTWKPRNVQPPELTGEAKVGAQVRCEGATWSGSPDLTERQYYAFESASDDEPRLVGAGDAYTVRTGDAGGLLACAELAVNEGGLAYATSGFSVPVVAAPQQTPVKPPPPPPPPPGPDEQPVIVAADPQPQAPAALPDLSAPRSTYAGRTCRRGRCTVALRATDEGSGVMAVQATLLRCLDRRCRRTRQVAGVQIRRIGGDLFQVVTPRLARGRHRLRAIAVDAAGNRQPRPLKLVFSAPRAAR